MQLSAVKIAQELLQLARRVHILEVREQIHMPEGIDCDQRQVRLALAKMMQRVSEPLAIGRQEIDVF